MNIAELVYSALKPKVASLGFNTKEIKDISAAIASSLNLDENATEEDATARIDESVGAIIPILKVSQSQGNRILDAYKASLPKPEPKPEPTPEPKPSGEESATEKAMKEMLATMKAMQSELNSLKTNNLTTSRKQKLEALLKESGTFGTRTIKNFERMTFANDEEFETFVEEVKTDLEAYNKERGEAGLGTMGGRPNPTPNNGDVEVITDKQIEAVANLF